MAFRRKIKKLSFITLVGLALAGPIFSATAALTPRVEAAANSSAISSVCIKGAPCSKVDIYANAKVYLLADGFDLCIKQHILSNNSNIQLQLADNNYKTGNTSYYYNSNYNTENGAATHASGKDGYDVDGFHPFPVNADGSDGWMHGFLGLAGDSTALNIWGTNIADASTSTDETTSCSNIDTALVTAMPGLSDGDLLCMMGFTDGNGNACTPGSGSLPNQFTYPTLTNLTATKMSAAWKAGWLQYWTGTPIKSAANVTSVLTNFFTGAMAYAIANQTFLAQNNFQTGGLWTGCNATGADTFTPKTASSSALGNGTLEIDGFTPSGSTTVAPTIINFGLNRTTGSWTRVIADTDGQEGTNIMYNALMKAGGIDDPKTHGGRVTCADLGKIMDHYASNFSTTVAASAAEGITTTAPSQTSGGSGSDKSTIDCDFSGNPLTWFVCPVVDGMVKLINDADGFITSALLYNNTDANSTSNVFNTPQYYKAWSNVRILATAIIVIAGLIMVASQALGMEILDAYTVRKVLPRLLVAIIGMSLSWPLMQFMVQFFNVFGVDIRNIIYGPFGGVAGSLGGGALTAGLTTLLLTGLFLGIIGALSFGLTALLAILTGFAIIVFRDIALTFIIVLAPIGIAGYILPNTQRLWKLWIDNFLGLLLMFPIIEAFIAIGHAFASVALGPGGANSAATGSQTLGQIIGFCAYFAPYFMLPAAFKLATGAIGTIAGVMGGHGLGERLKKYRGGKAAMNAQRMKSGERFNNRGLNALTSRASTQNLGFGARGRAAYEQKMSLAAMERAKSASGQAVQHNDPVLRAQTYGSTFEASRNMAKDFSMYKDSAGNATGDRSLASAQSIAEADTAVRSAIKGAQANGGFGRSRQTFAAQQLSTTATGYDSLEQVAQTISRVSHGSEEQMNSLAGNINSGTKQVGRPDLAPGFGDLAGLAKAEAKGNATGAQYEKAHQKATGSMDGLSIMRGKPAAVEVVTSNLATQLRKTPNDEVSKRKLHEMINGLSYGNSDSQKYVIDAVGGLNDAELQTHLTNALDAIRNGRSTNPNERETIVGDK